MATRSWVSFLAVYFAAIGCLGIALPGCDEGSQGTSLISTTAYESEYVPQWDVINRFPGWADPDKKTANLFSVKVTAKKTEAPKDGTDFFIARTHVYGDVL